MTRRLVVCGFPLSKVGTASSSLGSAAPSLLSGGYQMHVGARRGCKGIDTHNTLPGCVSEMIASRLKPRLLARVLSEIPSSLSPFIIVVGDGKPCPREMFGKVWLMRIKGDRAKGVPPDV